VLRPRSTGPILGRAIADELLDALVDRLRHPVEIGRGAARVLDPLGWPTHDLDVVEGPRVSLLLAPMERDAGTKPVMPVRPATVRRSCARMPDCDPRLRTLFTDRFCGYCPAVTGRDMVLEPYSRPALIARAGRNTWTQLD
jgi:hypothetical protein